MSAIAVTFLVLSLVIVWGGLVASVIYLNAKPEVTDLPAGGDEDEY